MSVSSHPFVQGLLGSRSVFIALCTVPGIQQGGRIEEKSAFSQPQTSCLQQNINSPGFKPDTGTMGQNVKLGPSQETCGDSLIAQSVKRIYLQCRRPGFNSCIGKIHWRKNRLPTPVFLGFSGSSDPLKNGMATHSSWVSLIDQSVKNLPAM